ncbi:hypothetical protein F4820DRAFT_423503 [Hypoxylon rubiginosum]|uniref:Uncharacterized protein n=1 Tax=Hypoxylon rubiginosum TaxID=110542 RepID=A0ACB9YYE8_9PEZI|nr:hypothetical protein F4820DRAFT_423503 [Hypoxylon rubiginosum]
MFGSEPTLTCVAPLVWCLPLKVSPSFLLTDRAINSPKTQQRSRSAKCYLMHVRIALTDTRKSLTPIKLAIGWCRRRRGRDCRVAALDPLALQRVTERISY